MCIEGRDKVDGRREPTHESSGVDRNFAFLYFWSVKTATLSRPRKGSRVGAFDKGRATALGRAMIQDAQAGRGLSKPFKSVETAMTYLESCGKKSK